MIDIKFLRENPEAVRENIRKKFQDSKLPLVDEVIELDGQSRAVKQQADDLRANRNKISKQIGQLMAVYTVIIDKISISSNWTFFVVESAIPGIVYIVAMEYFLAPFVENKHFEIMNPDTNCFELVVGRHLWCEYIGDPKSLFCLR